MRSMRHGFVVAVAVGLMSELDGRWFDLLDSYTVVHSSAYCTVVHNSLSGYTVL